MCADLWFGFGQTFVVRCYIELMYHYFSLQLLLFLLYSRYKNTSRLAMAKILIGLETGSHVDVPQAEFIECSAYRLEPITQGSYNDLDGEVIEAGPIQGQVVPGAMKVFCQ